MSSFLLNSLRGTSDDRRPVHVGLPSGVYLSLQIQHSDISIAHRLPSKKKDLEPNIIIRFTNRKARDMVFRARGQLTNLPSTGKIYINKDLSEDTAQLFRHARSMVKAKTLHAAWTNGGMLHVKTSPDCKATRINCSDDLSAIAYHRDATESC